MPSVAPAPVVEPAQPVVQPAPQPAAEAVAPAAQPVAPLAADDDVVRPVPPPEPAQRGGKHRRTAA